MSMTTITITESSSMPGRFQIHKAKGRAQTYVSESRDPGDAAAKALNSAQGAAGAYCIIGPAKVMAFIPEQVRSRA